MSPTATKKVLIVGLDLGTNTSVFEVAKDGKTLKFEKDAFPTLVGYAKQGIIPGILPTDADTMFADHALEYRLHLDLKWPLRDGFVDDVECCKSYTSFLRDQVDPKGEHELWAVVGAPANASDERKKDIRSAFGGILERILVVPEPFLAAMGLRDDDRVKEDASYVDPTKNSLIIDIGAGTTDCCLVLGCYPGPDEQISIDVAGDAIDEKLQENLAKRYPDIKMTRVTITKMKENHSFVGKKKQANVKVFVDGKPKTVDLGALINESCEVIIDPILNSVRELFSRCDSEAVEFVLHTIIVAGGGSQIRGLADLIQARLREEGYEGATTRVPDDYQHLVAHGALKIANNVRDDQWQVPI
ncbi:MAG: rod shape-determining protein [Planctomycetota bacterium]